MVLCSSEERSDQETKSVFSTGNQAARSTRLGEFTDSDAIATRALNSALCCFLFMPTSHVALSDFPRMGFDPFAEMRRMQSEMNCGGSGFLNSRIS